MKAPVLIVLLFYWLASCTQQSHTEHPKRLNPYRDSSANIVIDSVFIDSSATHYFVSCSLANIGTTDRIVPGYWWYFESGEGTEPIKPETPCLIFTLFHPGDPGPWGNVPEYKLIQVPIDAQPRLVRLRAGGQHTTTIEVPINDHTRRAFYGTSRIGLDVPVWIFDTRMPNVIEMPKLEARSLNFRAEDNSPSIDDVIRAKQGVRSVNSIAKDSSRKFMMYYTLTKQLLSQHRWPNDYDDYFIGVVYKEFTKPKSRQ